ncbi:helix-turn-helix domain-containing protein [Vibrio harveyi]|nr:helix-turn-helix domain-containing protein [Vibrio harveyi]
MSPSAIARQFRLKRELACLTQEDVAKIAGVRTATVSKFENDPNTTHLLTMYKILSALGIGLTFTTIQTSAKNEDNW